MTQDDYDETTAFLTSVINDQNGDSPIHVTAMMMGDDALLFDEDAHNEREDNLEVRELNANTETNIAPMKTNLFPKETILSPNETDVGDPTAPLSQGVFPQRVSTRLRVTLTFPGRVMADQRYTVPRTLLVAELKRRIACLLQTQRPVLLFIGPTWVPLDHSGCVTDRVSPGTVSPCPFLEDGSIIRVETGAKYTLIKDGSLFQLSFWEAECQFLQTQIQRQLKDRRLKNLPIPSRRIPTAEELQVQYITWLLEQPAVPLLSSPLSSWFYSAVWGCDAAKTPYESD